MLKGALIVFCEVDRLLTSLICVDGLNCPTVCVGNCKAFKTFDVWPLRGSTVATRRKSPSELVT